MLQKQFLLIQSFNSFSLYPSLKSAPHILSYTSQPWPLKSHNVACVLFFHNVFIQTTYYLNDVFGPLGLSQKELATRLPFVTNCKFQMCTLEKNCTLS